MNNFNINNIPEKTIFYVYGKINIQPNEKSLGSGPWKYNNYNNNPLICSDIQIIKNKKYTCQIIDNIIIAKDEENDCEFQFYTDEFDTYLKSHHEMRKEKLLKLEKLKK